MGSAGNKVNGTRPKIIFVNRFFHPDHSATSQLLSDLAFFLAREGSDVIVVTSRQKYDDPLAKLPKTETCDGVRIVRVWTSRFGRVVTIGRGLDYLSFYISAFFCMLKLAGRGDVIVTKTDPPIISVAGAVVSRIRKAALVNWIQDLFPEVAQALGFRFGRRTGRLLVRLRNMSLKAAVCNVVIGSLMQKKLIDAGVPSNRVKIVHNWADPIGIYPISRVANKLRESWGLQDKFVVGYSGNMGRAHEFLTVLNAAELLRHREEIVFVFIGGGAQKNYVQEEVNKRRLENIVFMPYQARNDLAESLSVPDLHIVSLWPNLEGLIVPSKYYGIAAAGRPTIFIGAPDGEIAQILAESDGGASIGIGDADSAARFICHLCDAKSERERLGKNARAFFDSRYSQPHALRKWQNVLKRIG